MRNATLFAWRRLGVILALAAGALALLGAGRAEARSVYLASLEGNSVVVLDATTGQVTGEVPLAPGVGPYSLAISPDGSTVWAVGFDGGQLLSIDTGTNQVAGAPITVPKNAYGFAITPDGSRAYLTVRGEDAVVAIDLQARQLIGAPIKVGNGPEAVAISPDGKRAYVSNNADGTISVIDTATNQVMGMPIPIGGMPYNLAITPDGSTLFAADQAGFARTVDLASGLPGSPIKVGNDPTGVAIAPNGARAYVSNYEEGTVSVIDTATKSVIGAPIVVGKLDEYLAVTPDGARVFVSSLQPQPQVDVIDTATNTLFGPPTPVSGGGSIAAVPDQSPTAAFSHAARIRPGVAAGFNASGSTDAGGTVTGFAWQFGDGGTADSASPGVHHRFGKPGTHEVTLTVTDNEGCSVALIFTGQTASCHGSAAARTTQRVTVAYPSVKVRCPRKARGRCRFALQAVARKKKGKLKPLTAVARVKVKPGKSRIVPLKPRKAFRSKLARAKKVLVRQVRTIGGKRVVKVRKLKIVR